MTGEGANRGDPGKSFVATAVLSNRAGLHARSAAALIREAARFNCEFVVRLGERSARSRSLTELLRLGGRQGDTLYLEAAGPDAEEALAAVGALIQRGFDED